MPIAARLSAPAPLAITSGIAPTMVETPVNLTSRQKEILREFEAMSEDNNPESKSFFSSVRDFWDSMKS